MELFQYMISQSIPYSYHKVIKKIYLQFVNKDVMSTVTKGYKMNSRLKTILTSEGPPLYLAFLESISLVIQKESVSQSNLADS